MGFITLNLFTCAFSFLVPLCLLGFAARPGRGRGGGGGAAIQGGHGEEKEEEGEEEEGEEEEEIEPGIAEVVGEAAARFFQGPWQGPVHAQSQVTASGRR